MVGTCGRKAVVDAVGNLPSSPSLVGAPTP